MSVRNLDELGINLQKIVSRLMNNDELINLLYYEEPDPLSQPVLTLEQKNKEIFQNLIKVVPDLGVIENSKCRIALFVARGDKIVDNKEFQYISICIDSWVPLTQWIIKDSNLRPFAILGQIQKSLEGKTINGLGKLESDGFELLEVTQEQSCYRITFHLTQYD